MKSFKPLYGGNISLFSKISAEFECWWAKLMLQKWLRAKSPSLARCKEGDLPLLNFSNSTCMYLSKVWVPERRPYLQSHICTSMNHHIHFYMNEILLTANKQIHNIVTSSTCIHSLTHPVINWGSPLSFRDKYPTVATKCKPQLLPWPFHS